MLVTLLGHRVVHGDIRHLENLAKQSVRLEIVHGDIRHLEMKLVLGGRLWVVHGDIRHLETSKKVQ